MLLEAPPPHLHCRMKRSGITVVSLYKGWLVMFCIEMYHVPCFNFLPQFYGIILWTIVWLFVQRWEPRKFKISGFLHKETNVFSSAHLIIGFRVGFVKLAVFGFLLDISNFLPSYIFQRNFSRFPCSRFSGKGTAEGKMQKWRNPKMQKSKIKKRNRKIESRNRKMESLKIENIQCLKRGIWEINR